MTAYHATINDPQFMANTSMMRECLEDKHYNSTRVGSAEIDDGWSEERIARAKEIEASCNDKTRFAAKALQIHASYERTFIEHHQDALVALEHEIAERVLTAHIVLVRHGLAPES